jgi:hypothetical protein
MKLYVLTRNNEVLGYNLFPAKYVKDVWFLYDKLHADDIANRFNCEVMEFEVPFERKGLKIEKKVTK